MGGKKAKKAWKSCNNHVAYSGPDGYIARHAWAEDMTARGIYQRFCKECKLWCWPRVESGDTGKWSGVAP